MQRAHTHLIWQQQQQQACQHDKQA
jgi:hypothetical protein